MTSSHSALKFRLRAPEIGDLGWIIHRQAIVYAEEYGWDWGYEGLVAEILGEFVKYFDPARDHGWVAERDGTVVGSVFLTHGAEEGVGKLRLLYVERSARGLGIGAALVHACIEHARKLDYATLKLWTNDVLVSARHLYENAGFRLEQEEAHNSFGKQLMGQTWSLEL